MPLLSRLFRVASLLDYSHSATPNTAKARKRRKYNDMMTSSIANASRLSALSPIDGRYAENVDDLREFLSEYGLLRYRVFVEIEWFKKLAATPGVKELPKLSEATRRHLDGIAAQFDARDAQRIKTIERATRHDVKAVEYFLRERFAKHAVLKRHTHFLHFACTSWDINNLAYSLMLSHSRDRALVPALKTIHRALVGMAKRYAASPMLSRTHGQPASPTTMGKEMANFAHRLETQTRALAAIKLRGKINGAVGNYNAHLVAYPQVDWPRLAEQFVTAMGLDFNPYTTQIEPYDSFAELLHAVARVNNILLDLCRDCWLYIAFDYFKQKTVATQVGSSTMPHKVNPIDFENAEGNLGVANALVTHLAERLCASRLQRDLSDSTALRALGEAFGHTLTATRSIAAGLGKLRLNRQACLRDLRARDEVLGEALQTVMRKNGVADAYEQIKRLTRGKTIDADALRKVIDESPLRADDKARLLALRPENYLGLADELASQVGSTSKHPPRKRKKTR